MSTARWSPERLGLVADPVPMGAVPAVVNLSPDQAEQLERTGSVVLGPVRTMGPTARERLCMASPRRTSVAVARPRERRDRGHARRTATRDGPGDDPDLDLAVASEEVAAERASRAPPPGTTPRSGWPSSRCGLFGRT